MDNVMKLNALRDYGEFKTLSDFARKLGVKPQVLSNWYARNTLDIHAVCKSFPEIDGNWLLTGEGDMFKTSDQSTPATISKKLRTHSTKRIPLYDLHTIGGYSDLIADTDSAPSASEWIDAGDLFRDATAAIRHYGTSMLEYPEGSILILRRVEDPTLLINGHNYVIETSEFRITKQLHFRPGDDYITAYSTNTEKREDGTLVHAPMRIPLSAIRHFDLVVGCVIRELSGIDTPR